MLVAGTGVDVTRVLGVDAHAHEAEVLAPHLLGAVLLGELHLLAAPVGDSELPRVAQVVAAGDVEVVDDLLAAEVVTPDVRNSVPSAPNLPPRYGPRSGRTQVAYSEGRAMPFPARHVRPPSRLMWAPHSPAL